MSDRALPLEPWKDCRHCSGRGTIPRRVWQSNVRKFTLTPEDCSVCGGSGRVEA